MLSGLPDINCEVGPQTDRLTAYNEGFHDGYNQAMSEMPEIVRCKDCKHVCLCDAEEMFPDMPVYAKCTLSDEVHEPSWFCADGEMKHE